MLNNLNEMFQESVKRWGDRVALRQRGPDGWKETSWNQWNEAAREICLGLNKLGLDHGDRIALIGRNCVEWVSADQGALSVGGAVVPIYVTNPAKDVAYVLENSESKMIILENAEQLKKVLETRDNLPDLKLAIIWDSKDVETDDFVMTLDELRELGREIHKAAPQKFEQLLKTSKPTVKYSSRAETCSWVTGGMKKPPGTLSRKTAGSERET